MKEIIKNYYTIIFGIVGGRTTSYRIAIFVVSVVAYVALSGLLHLLGGMLPFNNIILPAFTFPFSLATWAATFVALYLLYPENRISGKNPNRKPSYWLAILSAFVAVSLYAYSMFMNISNL